VSGIAFGGWPMLDAPRTQSSHPQRTSRRDAASHEYRRHLIEFVGLFLPFAIVAVARGIETAIDVQPSLLWIPVIGAGILHGTLPALGAAVLASAVTFHFAPPAIDPLADFYTAWLEAWRQPALWLATAAIIGEVRRHQTEDLRQKENRLRETREKAERLGSYAGELQRQVKALERHLAVGDVSCGALVKAILHFRSSADPLEARAKALFEQTLGPGTLSLEWQPKRRTATSLEPGRVYTIFDSDNEVALSAGALAICEVRGREGDLEIGILKTGHSEWTDELKRMVELFFSEISMDLAGAPKPRPARPAKPIRAKSSAAPSAETRL
jgi:hypothetical protein